MPGNPARGRPDAFAGRYIAGRCIAGKCIAAAVLWTLIALINPQFAAGGELRRSMIFMRPMVMGDAYAAMGDEASTILYNPASLAGLNDGSVEAFTPQVILGDIVLAAIQDPEALQNRYADLTQDDFEDLIGTTIYTDFNIRMPFVTSAEGGYAWGLGLDTLAFMEVLGGPVGPSLRLEYYFDVVTFLTMATTLGDGFQVGITPKLVNRVGINKIFTTGELFLGDTLSIEEDPAVQDLNDGRIFTVPGVDLGVLYHLPFAPSWDPRVAITALNIGGFDSGQGSRGMEFGKRPNPGDPPQAGVLPQINTIGFAISPAFHGIRYSLAFDVVDYDRRILPGENFFLRTRLGVEIGIGTRPDGTALFSFLFGLNAIHGSFGVMSRIWIFEIGFGTYRVELGEKPGDQPVDRTGILFGFRF